MDTKCVIRKSTISAVVTRADGTVEDLGVISEQTYDKPGIITQLRRIFGGK